MIPRGTTRRWVVLPVLDSQTSFRDADSLPAFKFDVNHFVRGSNDPDLFTSVFLSLDLEFREDKDVLN